VLPNKPEAEADFSGGPAHPRYFDLQAQAAAFYVALLKGGWFDEATEFAEWYLDTFDHDLET